MLRAEKFVCRASNFILLSCEGTVFKNVIEWHLLEVDGAFLDSIVTRKNPASVPSHVSESEMRHVCQRDPVSCENLIRHLDVNFLISINRLQ